MTRDTHMMATNDELEETTSAITFQVHIRGPSQSDGPTATDSRELIFDPVHCANLHNKIVELILDIQPSWRPHVKRNLFTIASRRFTLEQRRTWDPNDPSDPIPEQQLRERFGNDLFRFFELIDIIHVDKDQIHDVGPMDIFDNRFFPPFSCPDPSLFFDFDDTFDMMDLDFCNILQLYPTAYLYSLEAQTGGIMFDMSTGLATFARPMEISVPERKSWVPLDIVLNEWIKLMGDGKISLNDDGDELCENDWMDSTLEKALTSWNDYLEILERKVQRTHEPPRNPTPQTMIDDETLQKWETSLNKLTLSFLKTARRPAQGITRIAPGLSYFNTATFDTIHSAQNLRDQNAGRQRSDSDWLASLLFPAVTTDDNNPITIPERYNESGADISCTSYFGHNLTDRTAGLYVLDDAISSWLVDHEGKTEIFQRRDKCPWGEGRERSLAEMLRAWGSMVERGAWRVGVKGVEGGFEWFAGNREVQWVSNTGWGSDQEGGMDMGNDWVEWDR